MIYLISREIQTIKDIESCLGGTYHFEQLEEINDIFYKIKKGHPQLILLDLDLRMDPVLKAYKSIRQINSTLPVIILAAKPVISDVVALTKLGAEDFLVKPIDRERLMHAVDRVLGKKGMEGQLNGIENYPWLKGGSLPLKSLLNEVREILYKPVDLVLIGYTGMDLKSLAGLINDNSQKAGSIKSISLSSFGRDIDEALFWVTIQELLLVKEKVEKENIYGTIYISGLTNINPLFRESVMEFLMKRRQDPRFDKEIRIIIESIMPLEALEGFQSIIVPTLRMRKSDIAVIVEALIEKYSKRYSKHLKNISLDLIPFFSYYDFPGNYFELEELIKGGISRARGDTLNFSDLSVSSKMLENAKLNELRDKNHFNLELARREFERMVFKFVLENVLHNTKIASQFLDLPEPAFVDRIKELGL